MMKKQRFTKRSKILIMINIKMEWYFESRKAEDFSNSYMSYNTIQY